MTRDEGSTQELAPYRSHDGGARRDGDRRTRIDDAPLPLVPRGAMEILDLALEVLRDRFALIAGTCALLWVPARALEPFLRVDALAEGTDPNANVLLLALGSVIVRTAMQTVVQLLCTAVVAQFVHAAVHGQRASARDAFARALRCAPGMLVIAVVTVSATSVGFCCLVAPFIYLHWKLALAPSAYVLESIGAPEPSPLEPRDGRRGLQRWMSDVLDAFSRSFALSSGSFVRWLAIVVITFFLNAPFATPLAADAVPGIRHYFVDDLSVAPIVFEGVLLVITSLFLGLITAIGSAAMTLLYFDCRVRSDAYDLRRTLASLRASAASSLRPASAADAPGAAPTGGAP